MGTTYLNATVFTGRDETDIASAFTIEDGTFTWVGDEAELDDAARAGAVDLGGATVTPGFLDMHTHPVFTATLAGAANVLPPAVTSIDQLVTVLAGQKSAETPGAWILGFGYDESSYPEGRKPTRHDLDRVSDTHPVLVRRCDGHSAVCNTKALELAGIDADTPNPADGTFEREDDGFPNGILTEPSAVDAVDGHRPRQTDEELAAAIADLEEHYLSEGIVGMCDLLSTFAPRPLPTVRAAADAGFRPQCALFYGWRDALATLPDGPAESDTTGRVRIAGLKLFSDGCFSDRTAWCTCPYPGGADAGTGLLTEQDIKRAADYARAHGLQLAFHAMGDRAIAQIVDVLGDSDPWLEDVPSVRIDHATLIDPDMLARIEAAPMRFGIISHTIFYFAEYGSYEKNLTADLAGEAYPIRRYYDADLPLALASDAPATAWARADHVFTSIQAAITRRSHTGGDMGAGQAISLGEALLLYTSRAARISNLRGLGRIAPGYEGTFLVLSADPFETPADELDRIEVSRTYLRGQEVFRRG